MTNKKINNKIQKFGGFDFFNYAWMILFSLFCLLPLVIMVSASLSTDANLQRYGYTLLPKSVSFQAYEILFRNVMPLVRAYGISIFVTVFGTVLNLFFTSMIAFPLSKHDFRYKKWVTPLLLVTMLFSPGTVPSYILITQYLGWRNTIWVMIIPQIGTTFNIILLRTFFSDIPREIGESAKMDGCSVFREFLTMTMPLSMPALATCTVLMSLSYWNDWGTPYLYISDNSLWNIQYLMVKLAAEAQAWKNNLGLGVATESADSVVMATAIVGTVPIMGLFLYLQKYIVKGMTVGAVKG